MENKKNIIIIVLLCALCFAVGLLISNTVSFSVENNVAFNNNVNVENNIDVDKNTSYITESEAEGAVVENVKDEDDVIVEEVEDCNTDSDTGDMKSKIYRILEENSLIICSIMLIISFNASALIYKRFFLYRWH